MGKLDSVVSAGKNIIKEGLEAAEKSIIKEGAEEVVEAASKVHNVDMSKVFGGHTAPTKHTVNMNNVFNAVDDVPTIKVPEAEKVFGEVGRDTRKLNEVIDANINANRTTKSAADSADVFMNMSPEQMANERVLEREITRNERFSNIEKKSRQIEMNQNTTNKLNKNKYNSMEDYLKNKTGNEYDKAWKSMNGTGEADEEMLKKLGLKKGMSREAFDNARFDAIKGVNGEDFKTSDWLGYHKVPQKAVGVGGTAWLVSKMASTKGEQSNAQLYGQAPY